MISSSKKRAQKLIISVAVLVDVEVDSGSSAGNRSQLNM